jgi:glycosyltransferase involved in cell wall biosynthesis
VLRRAARIVVLSERARRVYESAGLPSSKLAVIPSFVPAAADDPRAAAVGAGQWLYAGRIAREKGLLELLARWPEGELLAVVGDGPLLDQARAVAGRDVSFLGPMPRQQLLAGLAGYAGLVFPSRCYEGSPMIVAEALARGLPVVALEGSSAADLVAEAGGGVTYDDEPGSLERALRTVREQRAQLSGAARALHLTHCSPEAWLRRTEGVYAHALAQVAG